MKINSANVQKYLKAFDFQKLFREELGWEPMRYSQDVTIGDEKFHLEALAHKRGFTAFRCQGQIPPYSTRRKIDAQVARSYHEHMIIYTDPAQTTQVWQWVKRQIGKPAASREHTFRREQSGQALIQKLEHLVVTLDDEENLTILDVAEKVRGGFDIERVTKRFYDRFKDEHAAFLKFVTGIPDEGMQRWYISVTLNRLMFVYFIQKKGFLDGDLDYLRHKLAQSPKGKNRFYRDFLCPLFFKGFAQKDHDAQTVRLLGKVPYLNGGIFARHQIEELYGEALDIPDKAFERLFSFFEEYQWHLDERPTRKDDEINPDVLGYIFEKYINQKQMGAYYTKEDITEYISKNTILPHLFDIARRECKTSFEGDRSIWNLLRENPDRYIYEAVRKGTDLPLPEEIAAGITDISNRTEWNKAAPTETHALPTEIWREVVARRQRYEEVREMLSRGEVREINDLITYNLDIGQFAQDVIENAESPELLRAFWKAIRSVTVLDPTVGSGAFLFAALNILEPLYEACLERMQVFLEELDASGTAHSPEKFSDFRKVLADVDRHPNRRYFVLKSIIVNNLYGVDIMDEAVEICKLRLFLKLVAQVEQAGQVEPLPDIDFNICAGNTLVGFATKEDVRHAVEMTSAGQMKLISSEDNAILKRIEEKAQAVERLFTLFRQQQTELGGEVRPEDKAELRQRLKMLDDELNIHLARQYGIHDFNSKEFDRWRESHKPFHWFVEFYGIMNEGGFDVIIGNPPYVEYRKVRSTYQIQDYKTEESDNLYVYVIERSSRLVSSDSRLGLIVPISLVSVPDNHVARQMLLNQGIAWFSNYAIRPAKLFDGVEQRLTICLVNRDKRIEKTAYSTKYNQWFKDERPALFEKITYSDITILANETAIPKSGSDIATRVLEKISNIKSDLVALHLVGESKHKLYFHRTPGYWIRMMDFLPYYKAPTGDRSIFHTRELSVSESAYNKFIGAVVNSTLYFFHFFAMGNCRNLTLEDVKTFPLGKPAKEALKVVGGLFDELMKDFNKNSFINHRGPTEFQEFDWDLSKPIIDEIDRALARHYGLTDEELDFIINYDIKYRMGSELEEGEE